MQKITEMEMGIHKLVDRRSLKESEGQEEQRREAGRREESFRIFT